jgi:uncharacterized RDD family membrane protein YckC
MPGDVEVDVHSRHLPSEQNPTGGKDQPVIRDARGVSQIITGEAVAIDLRVARVGSRLVGATLDALLQLVLFLLLLLLASRVAGDDALAAALTLVAYVLTAVGYPLVLEMLWGGRTLGKAAMGLRAVRDDGSPMRFRQALVRALMRGIVEGPAPLFGIPAVVASMISDRGKRLGDLLAGTVVLQERIPSTGTDVPFMPPPLAAWAGTLDLSRFSDSMALSARQFLGRAADLSETARESLGARLVASVQQVVTPPPPAGTPGWAYLAAVLAERRRREEQRHGVPGWGGPGWGGYGAPAPQPPYHQPQHQPQHQQHQPPYQPQHQPQPQAAPQFDKPAAGRPAPAPAAENPFTLPG